MRIKIFSVFFPILAFCVPISFGKGSTQRVKSYTKKDGTYVAPYTRTKANNTKNDNWSTKGNVNPYTGKAGTKEPDAPPSSPNSLEK